MTFVSYAQNFEDVMLWRALGYVGPGFYIDVGANAPTADSVTRAFYERGWHGINIEPLPRHFAELQAERPRDINLQLAVGETEGEITLHAPDVRGWATVASEVARHHDAQGVPMARFTVPLRRLDTLCARHAPQTIHFLKIDVEGYEKQVLAGMDFRHFRPWVVVVEAVAPHSWRSNSAAWEDLLLQHDYQCVYHDGVNRFYLADEHAVLRLAFATPPNVFDDFVRWETVLLRQTVQQLQTETAHLQCHAKAQADHIAAADAAALNAVRHARYLEAELAAIHASTAWRLSAPLRRIERQAKKYLPAALPAAVALPEIPPPDTGTIDVRQDDFIPQLTQDVSGLHLPARVSHRLPTLPDSLCLPPATAASCMPEWFRLTGHIAGHYSLAVVNRGLLHALAARTGQRVTLQVRDGDCTTLPETADSTLQALVTTLPPAGSPVCSIVHHYPLIHDPQPAARRLALFFWEENQVPPDRVQYLHQHVDAVLVASTFVKAALRNSGCTLPIGIIPLGVDHLFPPSGHPAPAVVPAPLTKDALCRFLHVSSVFPRKGPDVLLRAWAQAFTGDDPVELYIKTFPNPHNRIHAQWAACTAGHPNPPRLTIDECSLDEAAMLDLYRSAQALVLPTRGEGFNLPAAEALALGLPVLVTGYGAHTDFATLTTANLIPFRFAPSRSHLQQGEACWIEPDLDSLTSQLIGLHQQIRTADPLLSRQSQQGQDWVRQTHTWANSAEGVMRFNQYLATRSAACANGKRLQLHVFSPWQSACGIAEYSRALLDGLDQTIFDLHVYCDTRTPPTAHPACWTVGDPDSVCTALQRLGQHAAAGDLILIQHQPALFPLTAAICRAMAALQQQGCMVLLELHATRPLLDHQRPTTEAVAALAQLSRLIVHRIEDFNHLLALGLSDRLVQWPLGVPAPLQPAAAVQQQTRASLGLPEDALLLGSFGFLLPHKGIDALIEALPRLQAHLKRPVFLLAVNALPDPQQTKWLHHYQQQAEALEVAQQVLWHTDYLPIAESIHLLAAADVIIFPYGPTQESASAAVTIGLVTGKPVLVSNQPIFDAVACCTRRMAGYDAEAITAAVCDWLTQQPARRETLQQAQQDWLQSRGWPVITARLQGLLQGLHEDFLLQQALVPQPRPVPHARQLLVDVSELYQRDARTGIQRVVRNILRELQQSPPEGCRICPVYGTAGDGFRHTRRLDATPDLALPAEASPVQPDAGDIFLGLDLAAHLFPEAEGWLADYRRRGVAIHYVVYDIIPLLYPQWTVAGMPEIFALWLRAIARQADRLLCISAAVAADVRQWLLHHAPDWPLPDVTHFPLGADILATRPPEAGDTLPEALLTRLQQAPVFISVSTIEPRKGQAQLLAAFEQRWAAGENDILVLVGKAGWQMETFINTLQQHPEQGQRLFWFAGVSDAVLEQLYGLATALVAASQAEGFGLPLIEAARHGLPLIVRNIPVFREIAGEHAFYFTGDTPEALARALEQWQHLYRHQAHPRPAGMVWHDWQGSTMQLKLRLFPAVTAPVKEEP